MSFDSLRDFLDRLEKDGELCRVKAEVDKNWEVSSAARQIFAWPEEERPALMFENIKGYTIPIVLALFANRRRFAKAIGAAPAEIWPKFKNALRSPVKPIEVETGPCRQNIQLGADVDLYTFPVPVWSPDKDAGPYFTAPLVITRDPETGIQNVGTYRCHVQAKDRIGINIHRERHGGLHLTKWEERNKPMEVAVCMGAEPTVAITSVGPVPFGLDELAVAGGLKGRPVEVVRGQTVDLLIPATSEIVVEGRIEPGALVLEAPFGEFTGYMGGQRLNPRVDVTCITFRSNPVFHGFLSQRPPSESSMIRKCVNEPILKERLESIGIPGIIDLCMTEPSGSWFHIVASIKKMYPGHSREVMTAIFGVARTLCRRVIIVDEDIDPRNSDEVEWAVATRCRPDKDIVIIPEHITTTLDPVMTKEMQRDLPGGITAKYGIDATKSHEYSPVSLPDEKYLKMAREKWASYGIDKLDPSIFKSKKA